MSIVSIESRRNYAFHRNHGRPLRHERERSAYTIKRPAAGARIDPDSGYRYYTNGQIFLFQTIRLLQRTGMSLAEIRETLQKDPVDLRSLWDSQEKAILQKQQELHEMEIMVHQQQKQLEEASLMQQHAGKDRISNA